MMSAPVVLIADYANIEQNGKLNVMGIFQVIRAQSFPITHPVMHLVLTLVPDVGDTGGKRQLTVRMTDEDGNMLWELSGEIDVPGPKQGRRPQLNHIFALQMLKFPKAGGYTFSILVDDEHIGQVDIELVKTKQQRG